MNHNIYRDGMAAAHKGWGWMDCPYQTGSFEFKDWMHGFDSVIQEDIKRFA